MKAYEYDLPKTFDINALIQKTNDEISAMNYKTSVEKFDGTTVLKYEKDIGTVDMFLGRWQKQEISFKQIKNKLFLEFYGIDKLDKFVCFSVGILFFFIPYVFGLIAVGNRKNTACVAKKTIEDYIKKQTPSL